MNRSPGPAHIAIVNHSRTASSADVAFWTEAARIQLQDVARVWGIDPPGVFFYGPSTEIPPVEAGVIGIVDDDANATSAGYHSVVGRLVFGLVDLGQALIPSRTLSHEVIEMVVNPRLDWWVSGPQGLLLAVEACDPVQRSEYKIPVDVLGMRREVVVSNFVTPSWFGLRTSTMLDWLGNVPAPWTVEFGGYVIAQQDGKITHLGDRVAAARKTELSRTWRTTYREPEWLR